MRDSEKTKRQISNGLFELLASIPLRKISVQDISDSCNISRRTFYYNFLDKQDLINWIHHTDITLPIRLLIDETPKINTYTLLKLDKMKAKQNFSH